jgi:hypothetical protein
MVLDDEEATATLKVRSCPLLPEPSPVPTSRPYTFPPPYMVHRNT